MVYRAVNKLGTTTLFIIALQTTYLRFCSVSFYPSINTTSSCFSFITATVLIVLEIVLTEDAHSRATETF
jgi:fucose 4-O-acetylase-like acetyltransferase